MLYHAICNGLQRRYLWNRERDDLIHDLLIPVLGKQVVGVNRRGKKSLFNFGSVTYVTILRTSKRLKRAAEGKPPAELRRTQFVNEHNVTEEFLNEVRLIQSSPLSRSLLQQALSTPLNQLFVIMKFGDPELDAAYENIVKPVGKSFDYDVLRIDEIPDSGQISNQILENIGRSKVVFAELSQERPNCYYEAGYAHALGKEIIFSIRNGEKVHFDLSGYRMITWANHVDLRKQLTVRLNAIESREEDSQ